jgi:DNA-binding SARP family transcriptional activator
MLRLSLLGGFEARVDDGHPIVFPRRKAQALLAYLVLNPGRTHPRAKVASLLWSDIAEEAARTNLRQTLGAIRRALPTAAQPVVADPESVGLDRSVVGVDVWDLERLANEATPAVYGRVDDLYRGALLAGLGPQSQEFEAWLRGERERVREVAVNVLRRLLAHQTSANDPDAVVATGLRLLDIDPLQEPVYRTLMRVQAAAGRRAAALRQYQVCVSVLQRELGTEPELETKHLYQEILQRRVPSPTMRGSSGRRDSKPDLATDAHVLVGRDAEARLLRRAIGDVAARDGRVAVLVGEAGIGKSALLAAVADEAHAAGSLVVVGRCHESQQVLQFGPWVDALRAAIDDDDRVCSDLDAAWRAELARLLPQVSAPGLPKASNDLLRLFHSVWHLVERLAQRQPLALLLEDVHWADESSARLLAFVARRIRRRAVLLVVTAREEDIPSVPIVQRVLDELRSEPHVALLPVPPLSRADTAALIRHLLGTGAEAATVDRLREQVWKASAGNPFMVVETLRALQEGAVPTTISGLPLPDRVRQVVAARLARLGERTRTLVSVAAAIGREFDFRVLQHAADITERDAAEGVEELVRRRILRPVGDVFDFVHERIRDVAYGQLLPPQRRVLHAAVGRAIEDVHAGDLDAHLVALGAHYREGEVWDKAVEFLRRAGAQMIGRSAHRDAVSVYEQARAALARLPKTDAALATALELSFDLRTALQGLAAFDRILEELQEAERLARAIGDDRRLGQVFVYLTNHHYWTGALDRAVDYGEQALAIGVALDDFAIRVVAAQYLGLAHHARGDYRRGRELLEPAVGAHRRRRTRAVRSGVPPGCQLAPHPGALSGRARRVRRSSAPL